MAELKSETEEISDALKEKVLLNILKNQFRQDVTDEVEAHEDLRESAPNTETEETAREIESGDSSSKLPGSRESTNPQERESTSPEDHTSRTPGTNNAASNLARQEQTTTIGTRENPTHLENRSPEMSAEQQTTKSENQGRAEAENEDTVGSGDQAPPTSSKDEVKSDPIKETEERLAADESLLSEDQLKERHEKSQSLRAQANNLYKESSFNDAAIKYDEALQICPLKEEKDRSILHANRAAALMANHQNKEALPHLDRALELDPNYLKALERRARLNRLLEHLDDSLRDYEKLLELKPKHYAYIATIKELQEQIKKRDEELKAKMLDSLKQLGNVFLKPFGLSTENFSMVPNEGGGYSLQMKGQK